MRSITSHCRDPEIWTTGAYTKTGFVKKIAPQFIDGIVTGLEVHPERNAVLGFQQGGGALARVSPAATAFAHRDIHATAVLNAVRPATADATPHVTWLRRYWASVVPHTYGFFTNDAIEESRRHLDENHLGNYPRLVKVKNKYDPTNLFRLNANVRPTV